MRVTLVSVSRPLLGDGDPRRLVELAVKTSAGKVRKRGFEHYLRVRRRSRELNRWLIEAAGKFPSVLEHVVMTFMIEGVSRVCTHQLVRHRIASYTQESLRYSVLGAPGDVMDDALYIAFCSDEGVREDECPELGEKLEKYFAFPEVLSTNKGFTAAIAAALFVYARLIKEYRVRPEDARYALPAAVKTRLLMTVNLRELLHIGCVRLGKEAQEEIKEVVRAMFNEVEKKTGIPIWEMKEAYCGKMKHTEEVCGR